MQFTHKKHIEEYSIGCGDCHHNKDGQPLNNLKMGDAVQKCIACHVKPEKAPTKIDGRKPTDEEKLEYHADALHENCIGCHKDFNTKNNTKDAPASCNKCHPKS